MLFGIVYSLLAKSCCFFQLFRLFYFFFYIVDEILYVFVLTSIFLLYDIPFKKYRFALCQITSLCIFIEIKEISIIRALCSKIKKSAILRSNLKKSSNGGRSTDKNIPKNVDFIHWSYLGIWYCPILFRAEEGLVFFKINQM